MQSISDIPDTYEYIHIYIYMWIYVNIYFYIYLYLSIDLSTLYIRSMLTYFTYIYISQKKRKYFSTNLEPSLV